MLTQIPLGPILWVPSRSSPLGYQIYHLNGEIFGKHASADKDALTLSGFRENVFFFWRAQHS